MLNFPWLEVIAGTMSLLHLYCAQVLSVHTNTVFLTSLASLLWYLFHILVQSWLAGGKGLISKGNILSRLCPLSHLLSGNLPLLSTVFYLGWRMLEAAFIDCIIGFLNFSMVISIAFCEHKHKHGILSITSLIMTIAVVMDSDIWSASPVHVRLNKVNTTAIF